MGDPSWKDYRLFEFDELLDSVSNPPPLIVALVGPLSREISEKSMLRYWLSMSCMIHRWERDNVGNLIDLGGES